jgi:hypothetical protein
MLRDDGDGEESSLLDMGDALGHKEAKLEWWYFVEGREKMLRWGCAVGVSAENFALELVVS